MQWTSILGVLVAAMFIFRFEWPRIKRRKDKAVFVILLALSFCLFVLVRLSPGLPGPTAWADAVFKPLGRLLAR